MIRIILYPYDLETEPPYICEIEFTPVPQTDSNPTDFSFIALHDFISAN